MVDLAHWTPPPFPPSRVLEGEWCRLEPLSADRHAADIWQVMQGQDHLWDYMFPPAPQSESDYHALLAGMEKQAGIVPFAVIDKADGKAKGHLWIMEIRPAHGVFEVGSIMYAPAMQKTRAATEAIYLVGDYGFSLGYRRYEWKCNDLNAPSKRAALRYGFTYEGLFRQHMVIKGKNRDTAWYSITDGEWPVVAAGFRTWLSPDNFTADGKQVRGLAETRSAS
ncbi:MAG: GNAT family N-acetyltransferase [Beijerinckiaceae bacterium]